MELSIGRAKNMRCLPEQCRNPRKENGASVRVRLAVPEVVHRELCIDFILPFAILLLYGGTCVEIASLWNMQWTE